MKEYVLSCVAVGLVAAVGTGIAHTGVKKAVRASIGILVLCVFLTPLSSCISDFLSTLPLGSAPDTGDTEGFKEITEEAFSLGVERALALQFSLSENSIDVTLVGFDPYAMRAERAHVTLTDVREDYREIREYVCENFLTQGGICEVDYEV